MLAVLLAAALSLPATAATTTPPAAATMRQLGTPRLVDHLRLYAGLATLQLDGGVIAPLQAAGEARPREFLFVGKGRLQLEPKDPVEAQQLELFSGEPILDYAFEQLALFMPSRAAGEAILRKPAAGDADAATLRRLAHLQARWLASGERSIADVDLETFADDHGHPSAQLYFVAWALRAGDDESARARPLLYVVDPEAREQVTLGRFVRPDVSEREERKAQRLLHREQRHGRLLGLRIEQLGQFDTWFSASLVGADGKEHPGFEPFEPVAYRIKARLDDELRLEGTTEIELVPQALGVPVVNARLFRDLVVRHVQVGGQPAAFRRNGDDIAIALPAPSQADQHVTVAVTYGGVFVEKVRGIGFAARDAILWHPHVGEIDRAAYDVELRWPKRLDLVAGGVRVDGGESRGERWERRKLERPALAFGFELGRFDTTETRRGNVLIRVALDRASRQLPPEARQELTQAAGDALDLFTATFGPYPYSELTLVTVPRAYSQSLPGIVTLSDLMVADLGEIGPLLGLEDRRTVVAHEVAHQWWGHELGWSSYRDQWLSEALASWSAMFYVSAKLLETPRGGPTTGWQNELGATLADGRRIESVGPVTLGERLDSTVAPGAYQAIIYKKGAIVIDMLAQAVGRDELAKALHHLFGLAAGKLISTEVLIAALQRSAGVELDGFARQFVYGTGLPELSYEYSFTPSTPGHWKVSGTVRQRRLPDHGRCRVEATGPQGRLDVVCEGHGDIDVADWWLLVPFQVGIWDPKAPDAYGHQGSDAWWSGVVTGQLLVKGDSSPFELEVDKEPRRFWLDRNAAVFATFHDDTRDLKGRRYRQGIDAALKGDLATAERLWREAVAAEGVDDGDRQVTEQLDALIELSVARACLARDDDAAAAAAVARAAGHLGGSTHDDARGEVDVVQSRLDLRAGRFVEAYRRLKKTVPRRSVVDSAEAHLLLALAAFESGEREAFEDAVKAAEERGADVTALREYAQAAAKPAA